MGLIDYWPMSEAVDACIKPEAETTSEAVFLAVHQVARFIKQPIGDPNRKKLQSENDLLAYFLNDKLPSGTLIMPILGQSGVGKSHTVRWIDAQLRRREDAWRRHIIRIPKSASLKRVLELILEGLPGEDYDRIRKELLSTREGLDPLAATQHLRADLLVALERIRQTAAARVALARQQGRVPAPEDVEANNHCRRDCLPALLDDPVTGQWFIRSGRDGAGLLENLARRVLEGYQGGGGDAFQFTVRDLQFDSSVALQEASRPAQIYYQGISKSDGTLRPTAVRLLNQAIDGALAQLLNLGDNRLPDLFLQVRQRLLTEGKELVLLVEDFAALAGIQGALLDVVIKEAVRDGQQVLCTMRTALAVTEGYITNRDTVLTRAQFEWIMEETPYQETEEAVEAILELTGAYLNAARFGQEKLDQIFFAHGGRDLTDWVPRFESTEGLAEEERADLQAFGSTRREYALFPFCKDAVRQLATKFLVNTDSELRFNPRLIINTILRPVLQHREAFLAGHFPSPDVIDYQPNDITARVRERLLGIQSDRERDQYSTFLRFWGNNPTTLEMLGAISPCLYRAFSLAPLARPTTPPEPPLKKSVTTPRPGKTTVVVPTPDPGPKPEPPTPEPSKTEPPRRTPEEEKIEDWRQILDAWAKGQEMGQMPANQLRRWIAEGVGVEIDWDGALLKNPGLNDTYYLKWVYLPSARGGQPACTQDNALVTVCRDGEQRDSVLSIRIILALMAMVNREIRGTWEYPGGEEDYARFVNFIVTSSRQALEFVRKRYLRVAEDTVPVLAQALLQGAKVLDLPGASNRGDADVLLAVTTPLPEGMVLPTGNDPWSKLVARCHKARTQSDNSLRETLLAQVGARQGGGRVQAVDAARLLDALEPFRATWRMSIPPVSTASDPKFEQITEIRYQQKEIDDAIRHMSEKMVKWREKMARQLGEAPDKQNLRGMLARVRAEAKKQGIPSGDLTYDQLNRYEIELHACSLKEQLERAGKVSEGDQGTVLSAMAQANVATMERIEFILDAFDRFLEKATRHLEGAMAAAPSDQLETARHGVEQTLEKLVGLARSALGE